jgi:hypothetical protein
LSEVEFAPEGRRIDEIGKEGLEGEGDGEEGEIVV